MDSPFFFYRLRKNDAISSLRDRDDNDIGVHASRVELVVIRKMNIYGKRFSFFGGNFREGDGFRAGELGVGVKVVHRDRVLPG